MNLPYKSWIVTHCLQKKKTLGASLAKYITLCNQMKIQHKLNINFTDKFIS